MKLQAFDNDHLKVELAITVDAMMPFARATYNLEGDRPLCLETYEVARRLEAEMRNHHLCRGNKNISANNNLEGSETSARPL